MGTVGTISTVGTIGTVAIVGTIAMYCSYRYYRYYTGTVVVLYGYCRYTVHTVTMWLATVGSYCKCLIIIMQMWL